MPHAVVEAAGHEYLQQPPVRPMDVVGLVDDLADLSRDPKVERCHVVIVALEGVGVFPRGFEEVVLELLTHVVSADFRELVELGAVVHEVVDRRHARWQFAPGPTPPLAAGPGVRRFLSLEAEGGDPLLHDRVARIHLGDAIEDERSPARVHALPGHMVGGRERVRLTHDPTALVH